MVSKLYASIRFRHKCLSGSLSLKQMNTHTHNIYIYEQGGGGGGGWRRDECEPTVTMNNTKE